MIVVVKIGSSSLTDEHGQIDIGAISKLCAEVAELRSQGHQVLVVTSGAIAAGLPVLGLTGKRPTDPAQLQAVSAVGQSRLMRVYDDALAGQGLVSAQVLLVSRDFVRRRNYVSARDALLHLFRLGAVPVINENDAIADEEIRFGDNDGLAALVANLIGAQILVLLTDTPGLYSRDPRRHSSASLIEEIVEFDEAHAGAGRRGSVLGSGGMVTKLMAAEIAAWSGVTVVIAAASRPRVLAAAVAGEAGVGTVVRPRERRLSARKLWIAFAVEKSGTIVVDDGARRALVERGKSLLPAGIVDVEGDFDADEAVGIVDVNRSVIGKGLVRVAARDLRPVIGRKTHELPEDMPHEVIHVDDLVVDLP